jgi:hypothetical protein
MNNGSVEMDIPVSEREAAALENHGMRVIKKDPPSVISNQLRDELIRILKTGDDKNDGAFTIAIATQVEKFVAAARAILMTENLAKNDLSSLMMMRNQHPTLGAYTNILGNEVYPLPSIMPSQGNNENFGVQAIRQLVDSFRTANESPAKLVEALVIARENNLTDVVASLEKKLGVSKEGEKTDDLARHADGSIVGGPLQ